MKEYNYNFNDVNINSYTPAYDPNDRLSTMTVGGMMLFTPQVAYEKGNLFKDLYNQYKNYKPYKLVPKDERQKLFLEFSQMDFAAHELNLYLDLHPDDKNALTLFNEYRKKANSLLDKYESMYGPLTINSDALNKSPFLWEEENFPFDKGGVSNV